MSESCGWADQIAVCCLSNDAAILEQNLLSSPAIQHGRLPLDVERDPISAAIGLNRLLNRNSGRVCVLAHHDVYLPNGWKRVLLDRIAEIERHDANWGLMAAYGIGLEGRHWGPVWSSALSGVIGGVPDRPQPIQSADELLIVLRPGTGLRFDEAMPHFHFYGTDVVQTARVMGLGAYASPMPVVHNDLFDKRLGRDYRAGYHFIRRKWRTALPLRATTATISWHGLHLAKSMWRMRGYQRLGGARASNTALAPQQYAERCGWNTVC